MNPGGEPHNSDNFLKAIEIKFKNQSSLDMYEWFSPSKNRSQIPYIENNPVIDLIKGVSKSTKYLGPKNIELGNFYYRQGRFERAIQLYQLNVTNEKNILNSDRKIAYLGMSRCYLELYNLSASINYFHRACQISSTSTEHIARNLNESLFIDITLKIYQIYQEQISTITNSLDLYEFVGNLIRDNSGWLLAQKLVEYCIETLSIM